MTWIAPEVTRPEKPYVGDERTMLEGMLEFHRQTLLHKCAGLTGERLTRRSVPPSGLSLLGIVRHMAEVERWWFRRRAALEEIGDLYCSQEHPDGDFDNLDPDDAEQDFATYLAECEMARQTAARLALEHTFVHPRQGKTMSMRWVHLHMIEEYARHNGHADLIRERIDGAVGA